jgi:YD repeat-containing protein
MKSSGNSMRKSCRSKRGYGYLAILAFLANSAIGAAFAANGSVTYTYDALGRVTTANYDTGVCVIYSYDANGNRLSQTIRAGGTNGVWGCFNWGQANWGIGP